MARFFSGLLTPESLQLLAQFTRMAPIPFTFNTPVVVDEALQLNSNEEGVQLVGVRLLRFYNVETRYNPVTGYSEALAMFNLLDADNNPVSSKPDAYLKVADSPTRSTRAKAAVVAFSNALKNSGLDLTANMYTFGPTQLRELVASGSFNMEAFYAETT